MGPEGKRRARREQHTTSENASSLCQCLFLPPDSSLVPSLCRFPSRLVPFSRPPPSIPTGLHIISIPFILPLSRRPRFSLSIPCEPVVFPPTAPIHPAFPFPQITLYPLTSIDPPYRLHPLSLTLTITTRSPIRIPNTVIAPLTQRGPTTDIAFRPPTVRVSQSFLSLSPCFLTPPPFPSLGRKRGKEENREKGERNKEKRKGNRNLLSAPKTPPIQPHATIRAIDPNQITTDGSLGHHHGDPDEEAAQDPKPSGGDGAHDELFFFRMSRYSSSLFFFLLLVVLEAQNLCWCVIQVSASGVNDNKNPRGPPASSIPFL